MATDLEIQTAYLRAGRNAAKAARSLGMAATTYKDHLARVGKPSGEPPDDDVTLPKPRFRVTYRADDCGGKYRVVAIGDAHDSPNLPKDRFRWIGLYVNDVKPDLVRSIGDWCTFDSLCSYDGNETLEGKFKPAYKEDIASLRASLGLYQEGRRNHRPDEHITLGNHEDRVFSFMNRNPELAGFIDETLHTVFQDHGWTYSPFGALDFVAGVAFTHVPLTRMGRPFGGEHSENQIGSKLTFDLVYGHTHVRVSKAYAKIGDANYVRVVNLASALPHGHVERYAKHALTGAWDYGVYDLTIERGHIVKDTWISMLELEERYG